MSKLGQFGHTFRRSIVRTVEQRDHGSIEAETMWKRITLFLGFPMVALASLNCYLNEKHPERKEFIHYSYLKIMNKPFPWKDGKKSLFHNPRTNYVPGIGYEA